MNRLLLLTGLLLLVADFSGTKAADRQPNVLFILADDQSYETIAAFGHTDIETPNLDRLVKSGTTFTRCYNQGGWSGAVCVASRTMLVTGRSLWNAEKIYGQTERERQAGRFWTEYLKQAGYKTYFTGKWHIQANAAKSFDVARHVRPGMPNQTPQGYNRPLPGQPDAWKPWDTQFEGFWKGGRHWSEIVADDADEYLRDAKQQDQPFFLYVAFNAPHDPRQSPREYVEKYPLDRIQVPGNFLAEYPHKEGIGCGKDLRDESLGPFPRTGHSVKVHRQEYYAIITHLDAQVGRILDTLEQTGQAENTWIFFTADHGLAVGHHGLMGKQNMYDHSLRVPFIVVGPGVAKNKQITEPIYLQDVMPTVLELAGVEKPDHVDFHSLLPLLDGQPSPYPAIYGAYLQLQRSVTHAGYKLILYPPLKTARLYHLTEDPQEWRDLAASPETLPRQKALFATLRKLQQETGDPLDLTRAFPQLAE